MSSIIVPKALESPKPTEDKSLVGTAFVIGDFSPKADYVPFGQGLETLHRRLEKPVLLDVPSDENM